MSPEIQEDRGEELNVDISEFLDKAKGYQKSVEDVGIVHRKNARYNSAQYELNQAILRQQEALK